MERMWWVRGERAERRGWPRGAQARRAWHTGLAAALLVAVLAPWSGGHGTRVAASSRPSTAGPLFCSPATYPTGGSSIGVNSDSVAVGDFDGDGKPDLAVANSNNTVSVLLGRGDGTFQSLIDYPTGVSPTSVAVGDFNGDGKMDIVSANYHNSVSVLLGNGDGTFQSAINYPAGGGPSYVAVGDFNGDGKQDLAVADSISNTVSVLLGYGNGTFQVPTRYSVGAPTYSVAVADFNGDGKQDLAVADSISGTVSVLLGNGDGTFQSPVSYPAGPDATSVAVGDFNGDGKQDLAVVDTDSNSVSVLLGNGDGTFQPQTSYSVDFDPFSVAVGDINGDGIQDLVVAGGDSENVSLLLGNGDGTFQRPTSYSLPAGSTAATVAVGDFNGDGKPDLAVANDVAGTTSVLLQGSLCLTDMPVSGYPDHAVRLNGHGFSSNEAVALYWDGTSSTPLTTTMSGATGAFSVTVHVPSYTPYGMHTINAVGQSSARTAATAFQITPLMTLGPTSGPSGTVVTAVGVGFVPTETVTLVCCGPFKFNNVLGTTTSDATGSFQGDSAITGTIPSLKPGRYKVCADGTSETKHYACRYFTVTG